MPDTWNLDSIPDLSEQVVLITGANSGIGFAIARELARKRAITLLACRNRERGEAAAETIRAGCPTATLRVMHLDLGSLDSIRQFAEDVQCAFSRLDLLINNAGVMFPPRSTTNDGFERTIGINHLGHFALTGRLIGLLNATPNARVVTVSSLAHATGRPNTVAWLNPQRRSPSAARAYANSKLANLLFAIELHRRLTGTTTQSLAAHPGGTPTGLGRHMEDRRSYRAIRPFLELISQSVTAAAQPILRAATDPAAEGGQFFGPSGRWGFRGAPVPVRPCPRATDPRTASLVWGVSTRLTGVNFLLQASESPGMVC